MKCYDGADIKKKCVKAIKNNQHFELDDYMIYREKENIFSGVFSLMGIGAMRNISMAQNKSENSERWMRVSKSSGETAELNLGEYKCFGTSENYCYIVSDELEKNDCIIQVDVGSLDRKQLKFKGENWDKSGSWTGGDINKIQVNDRFIVFKYKKQGYGNLCYCDLQTMDATTISLSPIDVDGIDDFYLVNDAIIIEAGFSFYMYSLLDGLWSVIEEDVDILLDFSLDKANYYKWVLYTVDDSENEKKLGVSFIDLNKPTSIQQFFLPGDFRKSLVGHSYGKIYYISMDEDMDLWCYDMLAGECYCVLSDTDFLSATDVGIVRKKYDYSLPSELAIVGDRVYFCDDDGEETICRLKMPRN